MKYKHAREVFTGLVLSLICVGLAGLLAWLDPFENGVPWVNWLVISVVAIIAVAASTGLNEFADDDATFFNGMGTVLFLWGSVGAMGCGFATTIEPALDPRYHSLAWTAYAVPMGIFIITAMIQYLIGRSRA